MTVIDILKDVPESLVELWDLVEVYKQGDKIVGAMFSVSSDVTDDVFKFALSSKVINCIESVKNVFASEMKARVHTDVQTVTIDGHLRCCKTRLAVEVRESTLDYVFDSPSSKQGYVFIDGSKYRENDVVVFDIAQTLLDALDVCTSRGR